MIMGFVHDKWKRMEKINLLHQDRKNAKNKKY